MTETFITKVTAGSAYFRRASGLGPGQRAVLALDPGYRVGWAIISMPSKRIEAAGFVEMDRDHLFSHSAKTTSELIEVFKPCAVLFEQYFVGGGAFAGDSIEMRGAMKLKADEAEIRWANVPVATVRSRIGLRARRTDRLVREAVLSLMNVPQKYQPDPTKKRMNYFPADVWDACGVAWAADTVDGL